LGQVLEKDAIFTCANPRRLSHFASVEVYILLNSAERCAGRIEKPNRTVAVVIIMVYEFDVYRMYLLSSSHAYSVRSLVSYPRLRLWSAVRPNCITLHDLTSYAYHIEVITGVSSLSCYMTINGGSIQNCRQRPKRDDPKQRRLWLGLSCDCMLRCGW